jgi:hypothetical protein
MDDLRLILLLCLLLLLWLVKRQKTRSFTGTDISVPSAPSAQRPRVSAPVRFHVVREGGELKITVPWQRTTVEVLMSACCGPLLIVYLASRPWESPSTGMLSIVSAAIGAIGLSYYALAGLVNRTIIRAGRERLRIYHAPLPWLGTLDLPVADVQQLYAARRVIRRGRRMGFGVSVSYMLRAVLQNERQREIVGGLREAEDALYLEQELESHLGIPDQAVPGELPRQDMAQMTFGYEGQRLSPQPSDRLLKAPRQGQSRPERELERTWGGMRGTILFLAALLVPLGALGWLILTIQEPLAAIIYGLVALIIVGALVRFVLSQWKGEIIDIHGVGMGQRYTHIRQPNGKRKKLEYSHPDWQLGSRLEKRRGEFRVRHDPRR